MTPRLAREIMNILMSASTVDSRPSLCPDGLAHTLVREAFPERGLGVPDRGPLKKKQEG
jgi:hypothetical protein